MPRPRLKILFFIIPSFFILFQCNVEVEPYFGLTPPSDTAKIFAPGIVSVKDRYEFGISFTPELDEVFFSASVLDKWTHIFTSKFEKGEWTRPDIANFTKNKMSDEMEAFVSPDGQKIFFTASDSSDIGIWLVQREGDYWSVAKKLDSPINSGDIVFYSNAAANGDLYYTNVSKLKMYYSPYNNGKYNDTIPAGIEYGGHGFISPEQDFMLIDAFKENNRDLGRDIHVCFRKKDGSWGSPLIFDERINSEYDETCPSLSPDGKILFFSRYNDTGGKSDIYWVSSELIQKLKKREN